LAKAVEFHRKHGAEGTLLVTRVEEPSKYGVVVCAPGESTVERFVEKPTEYVSNRINAGIYVLNPRMLDRIQPVPTSIETQVFPKMAQDGELHAMDLEGFWMDVGQPKDYLAGIQLYAASRPDGELAHGESFVGRVLVHPTATIGKNCKIGPNVTIGANAVIEDGVRISRAAVLDGARIGSYSWISNAIVGWQARIGRWVRVEGVSVLGEDVSVNDELFVNGGIILPNKSISKSIVQPQIVM